MRFSGTRHGRRPGIRSLPGGAFALTEPATEIDRSGWGPFFDSVTNSLNGKQAEIEVISLDLGDQIEADWTPLIGITYDHRNDLIEIALDELDHRVRSPRQIFVDYGVGGILAAIDIIDADANRQIVKLKDPL